MRSVKLCLIILILTLANSVHGQEQTTVKLNDGYQQFKYPNGTISSEGYIRDGKPDGYWRSYYITGVLKSEGKRSMFQLDSIWIFYDQTGDTIEKISYLFGKKSGYYLKYGKDNIWGNYLSSRELYAGDKKEGNTVLYYPNGKVKQEIHNENGKKEGLSREYDIDGNLITLYEYRNDNLVSRERINRRDGNNLRQGTWKEFYPGGGIKTDMNYIDDLLHGYYKSYDERGRIVSSLLYNNGVPVESVNEESDIEIINKYSDNGSLIYSGPYRRGMPVGVHREYDESGTIKNAKIYNDKGLLISEGIVDEAGIRRGQWKEYTDNGKLAAEGLYLDNRKSGSWKFYSESGKVIQTGSYNAGRPDGLWKWYYESGNILREEYYFQGRRDGTIVEYSEEGTIIAQGDYVDGEKNGPWLYVVGDTREEGAYIIGLRDGIWKTYSADGKLLYKGSYVQGNPNGTHIAYYENGKVREERYYEMGIRQRTWRKYTEDGTLLIAINYKDDIEKSINGIRVRLPEGDTKLIK